MAEMKSLNGNTFVDQSARNEIEALKKNGVGGGGGDVSTGAMQAAIAAAIAAAIQEHNEEMQPHPIRIDPIAKELIAIKQTVSELTAEKVGADPAGTAATKVSEHDTYTGSHQDIRLLIKALQEQLNKFLNVDDTTRDELSEVLALIDANAGTLESLTSSKVNVADIINNLTTNVPNKPLSAAQGVALKALIDALSTGKLDASALNSAITQALAEAKESGEFKGDPGTSVAVKSVSESTASGGENVVTFSDGKTLKVKNGKDGPKGDPYTLTEADKSGIVDAVIESLGGNPIFGYVDGDNNIVVRGSLAVGTYSVKYEMENGSTVDIGDLILGQDVHCSITKNLTNCTINNSATQVNVGDSFSATISANSGYVLSSVKITMGGTDVTSSVYSNGVITIGSVTGNVVITASAVKEAAKTYTITNNLTNCTNSNSVTVVEEGTAYSATITAKDGYELTSVTATMAGSAVTVNNGVINIASVTGNIVITAVAEEVVEEIVNWIANSQNADGTLLASTNNGLGYKANTRLGTSDGCERSQSGIECTGYIPVTINDTLYFKGVTVTSSGSETLCFYDSSHQFISGGGSSTSTLLGTMDGSVTMIKLSDIKAGAPANNPGRIAYIRISASEINANSIITKNQPIE